MSEESAVVQVAVPRPLRRLFDYAAPHPAPPVGARVRVPFARARTVGVVAGYKSGSRHSLKAVLNVLDSEPFLPPDLMELAGWLAAYYHHPIGEVVSTMLPAKARRGAAARQVQATMWRPCDAAPADLARAPRQREVHERLRALGGALDSELRAVGLARRALVALEAKRLVRRVAVAAEPAVVNASPHEPSAEQAAAVAAIAATLNGRAVHLLDGVTGSGKTEVYLRVIAEVLRAGRQALVLVPEIALTPQTVARFSERFGAVATLHSAATDAQRFDTWLKCRDGTHRVLIGTRSAALAPFAALGVIVVDEEHDGSFKQTEGLPYSARDVAVKRGQMLSIPVVLGSATPSLASLENARAKRYRRLRLTARVGGATLPAFHVVDIRAARLDRGLSPALQDAIAKHLAAGNQVLVFINRRGYAPVLLCSRCAWRARCARCDAHLTFHASPRQLRCHHCGAWRPPPQRCPSCVDGELALVGSGTQRVEEALRERHPDTPIYRVDSDTTRSVRRLAAELDAVHAGAPAILVGTQMLAKGHHLPGVTLVGVVDADSGFLAADFRAPERTAQLIVQVAGRAGRAQRPGEVLIQSFDPDNANLRALIRFGYHGFIATERAARAAAGMPPFAALALVRARGKSAPAAQAMLAQAADILAQDEAVETLGPAPAPLARRADLHRWQLLALGRRPRLHRALARLADTDPQVPAVSWAIDVDPVDAL